MSTKNNPNETKKAVIFARVSTEAQNYDEQINRMMAVALADGYKRENLIEIAVKESAIKKSEEEREGLNLLKEAVTNDCDINAVYVFEISRLGRRMDVISSVVEWLTNSHIQLVCDTPNIRLFERDGSVSFGAQMMIYLMGVLASQEMKIKKERFANGKARAKKEGRFVGGSVKFGYCLNEKKQIIVDESKVNLINTIFDMYIDGQGNEAIANYMNEMGIAYKKSKTYTRSRVSKFISDEAYKQIVGEQKYNDAQSVRANHTKHSGKERKMSMGERLIKCADCGRNFRLVGRNYVCSGHKAEYRDSGAELDGKALYCPNSTNLNVKFVDATLVQWATIWYGKDLMADNTVRQGQLQKELDDIPYKMLKIEKDIEKLQGKKDRIAENYEDGMIDRETKDKKFRAVDADMKKAVAEKEALEIRKREIESSFKTDGEWKFIREMKDIENLSHAELYEIVHNTIDRVEADSENGRNYWTIYGKSEDRKVTYWSCGKGAGVKLFQGEKGKEEEATDYTKVQVFKEPTAVYKNLLIGGESQIRKD